MAATDLRDQLQTTLGDAYRIERELPPGGMSRLFLATERSLDRQVVIKVLPPEYASEVSAARFQREVTLTAHLQHPHILPIHAAGSKNGLLYYVMPYVEGESLRERLDREGKLPVPTAVQILREVADALACAHEAGVVHRDIKPENILLQRDHALLADFGVARALHEATGGQRLTDTGSGLGTPGYMAPEQLAGDRHVDARADVYALAVVGYEMLAGTPPFVGATPQAVAAAHFTSAPKPLAELRSDVPPAVSRAIGKALANEPAQRFGTAAEFRDALTGAPPDPATPRAMRLRSAITAMGALLLLAGVTFAWRGWHSKESAIPSGPVRLAVLPFDNLGDSADAYFADGLTDAVRGKLTALPGLEVIGSSSSAQYRRTTKTPQKIGQELGVRYLLIGKVRWAKASGSAATPSRVQVSPELVEVSSAADKWEQPFDAPLTDVFQVQADIAGRVARALNVALGPTIPQTLAARPTTSPEAYDLYLRANEYYNHANRVDVMIAIQLYERAVTLDSSFAAAWAKLAIAHAQAYWFTWDPSPKRLDSARHAAERALALQPELPEGHLAMGYYHYWGHRDYERALTEFALTARSQPNNADVLEAVGYIRRRQGRWPDAIASLKRSVELDPLAYVKRFELGASYAVMRDNSEAERQLDRAIALAPDLPGAYGFKIVLYVNWAGHRDQAPAVMREALGHMDFGKLIAETPSTNLASGLSIDLLAADPTYSAEVAALQPASFGNDLVGYFGFKAAVYRFRHQTEQARIYYDSLAAAARNQLRERPDEALIHGVLGVAEAYLGHRDRAIQEGRRAVELLPMSKDAYYGPVAERQRAEVYTVVGAPDMAIDQLQAVLAVPSLISAAGLAADPTFAPLHGNSRFERLIAQSP